MAENAKVANSGRLGEVSQGVGAASRKAVEAVLLECQLDFKQLLDPFLNKF